MNTKGLTFAEMDERLNREMIDGVICEAFPLEDGNGYMATVTEVRKGQPGRVRDDGLRYATQGQALGAAYWYAVTCFSGASWVQISED